MDHDHGRAVGPDGLPKELADAHRRAIERTNVDGVNLNDMILAIEQDRTQVFLLLEPMMNTESR